MKEFLDQTLINLGNYELKVHALLMLAIFLIAVVLVLFVIRHTVYRISKHEVGKKFAIYSLIKYIIVVIAFLISLQILGFKLTVLLAGSAALLVGIGLGLQNLFGDFVSGIILLADTAIKVNDVIEVNGLVCQVLHINLRTTTVITRDDKYIILPNRILTNKRRPKANCGSRYTNYSNRITSLYHSHSELFIPHTNDIGYLTCFRYRYSSLSVVIIRLVLSSKDFSSVSMARRKLYSSREADVRL